MQQQDHYHVLVTHNNGGRATYDDDVLTDDDPYHGRPPQTPTGTTLYGGASVTCDKMAKTWTETGTTTADGTGRLSPADILMAGGIPQPRRPIIHDQCPNIPPPLPRPRLTLAQLREAAREEGILAGEVPPPVLFGMLLRS